MAGSEKITGAIIQKKSAINNNRNHIYDDIIMAKLSQFNL